MNNVSACLLDRALKTIYCCMHVKLQLTKCLQS